MKCKTCNCKIYNIMKDGNRPEDYVHKNHKPEAMYKCTCGCINPVPEKEVLK